MGDWGDKTTDVVGKAAGAVMAEPFTCPGCHSGDFVNFDHYFDVQGWEDGQEGEAFGCWLAGRFKIDITGAAIDAEDNNNDS